MLAPKPSRALYLVINSTSHQSTVQVYTVVCTLSTVHVCSLSSIHSPIQLGHIQQKKGWIIENFFYRKTDLQTTLQKLRAEALKMVWKCQQANFGKCKISLWITTFRIFSRLVSSCNQLIKLNSESKNECVGFVWPKLTVVKQFKGFQRFYQTYYLINYVQEISNIYGICPKRSFFNCIVQN